MRCGGNRATSLVCQQSECGPSRTSFVVLLPSTGDLKGGIVPSATCARKLFMFSFLRGCVMRQPHRWQQKRWLFSDPGLGHMRHVPPMMRCRRGQVVNSYVMFQFGFLVVSIVVRAFLQQSSLANAPNMHSVAVTTLVNVRKLIFDTISSTSSVVTGRHSDDAIELATLASVWMW